MVDLIQGHVGIQFLAPMPRQNPTSFPDFTLVSLINSCKFREQGELREKSQSKKREDFKFAQEFASHCSSIGNALRKHDLKVRGEDRQLMRSRRVKDMQVDSNLFESNHS